MNIEPDERDGREDARREDARRDNARREDAPRDDEDRQAFLLRLSDAFRGDLSEESIGLTCVQSLAVRLNVDRCYIVRLSPAEGVSRLGPEYRVAGLTRVAGQYRYEDFPDFLRRLATGPLIVPDMAAEPGITPVEYRSVTALGLSAFMVVHLGRGEERGIWLLAVGSIKPRDWSRDELHLLEEVAERTWVAWERARSETRLREREAELVRVQRIGEVGGISIDVAAGLRSRRSPEYLRLHGLDGSTREESHADWLERVHPEDREQAERALFDALNGAAHTYESEYRIIRPSDGAVRWIHARADIERDTAGAPLRLVGAHVDISEQKCMQDALRESEERQTFLLKVRDTLRPLTDAVAIQQAAVRLLVTHLGVSRALCFGVKRERGGVVHVVESDYAARPGLPSMVGEYPQHNERENLFRGLARGEAAVMNDIQLAADASRAAKELYVAANVHAWIAVPVTRGSDYIAGMVILHDAPRAWTAADVGLVRDVAERTWWGVERARAEAALRHSEEKYRSVFAAIDEGFCLIEMIEDAQGQAVDYRFLDVNPAFERHTGLESARNRCGSELTPGTEQYWLDIYGGVARDGGVKRFENYHEGTGRWYEVYATRVAAVGGPQVCIVFNDITERKRAAQALRQNEERQVFLLRLSDTLRPLTDPVRIKEETLRLLGESLGCAWAYYAECDSDPAHMFVRAAYHRDPGRSLLGSHPVASPDIMKQLAAGRTVALDDTETSSILSEGSRSRWSEFGMRSILAVPIVKNRVLLSALIVADDAPRNWTQDVQLIEEAAQRTWAEIERGHAEAALRESEERFRHFADASSGALWIRNADTLAMEYASPAITKIYGIEPDALLVDVKSWAAAIVPEDREMALKHMEQARSGEPAVHEFRIQRVSDRAFRWVRTTDFPLLDAQGRVHRIAGIAEDVTDARLAVEHQGVLLAELQHRVRNIMAIIRSITARTGERAESVREYASLMAGRLLALARVQALLTRAATMAVGIRTIVHDEVSVQAQHEGQYALEGPDILLAPKAAEVLSLAVHELSTNALKYGALSIASGKITVQWTAVEKKGRPWLVFDWIEQGMAEHARPRPGQPRRRGFGTELIEGRIPYELSGIGRLVIEAEGARCHLEFPLSHGNSILETTAPQRATVFGGALDMTGTADLRGRRIMVVEDEYYLAWDAARALHGAGAEVIGPCASEEAAVIELERQRPDAVLLDINLGAGPAFKLAETLKDRGIPFVFVTGYDLKAIPEEFNDIERLEKPAQLRRIVGAIARLLDGAARRAGPQVPGEPNG